MLDHRGADQSAAGFVRPKALPKGSQPKFAVLTLHSHPLPLHATVLTLQFNVHQQSVSWPEREVNLRVASCNRSRRPPSTIYPRDPGAYCCTRNADLTLEMVHSLLLLYIVAFRLFAIRGDSLGMARSTLEKGS